MFFDMNGQDYQITSDLKEKNIDINLNNHFYTHNFNNDIQAKIKLGLNVFFSGNNINYTTLNDKIYYITIKFFDQYKTNVFYLDWVFNLVKAYYFDFKFSHNTNKFIWKNKAYKIPKETNPERKNKIFISTNFTNQKKIYRPLIANFLRQYEYCGHLSYNDGNNSKILVPHYIFPKFKNIDELESKVDCRKIYSIIQQKNIRLGFSPIHNLYYENSFLSIFGETCEVGHGYTPTEKTYDPLIKGHFILPFSNSGYINHLKKIGFKFPKFINYEYDFIENDDLRFKMYTEEIERLLNLPIKKWKQEWQENFEIISYNQNIFYYRPYETLDLYKMINNPL